MKYWVQFYWKRKGKYVEALGSFGINMIDGRLSRENKEELCRQLCERNKYDGWKLYRGNRLDKGSALTANVRPR